MTPSRRASPPLSEKRYFIMTASLHRAFQVFDTPHAWGRCTAGSSPQVGCTVDTSTPIRPEPNPMRKLVVLLVLLAAPLAAQQRRALTFEDFAGMRGVSDPQISPDGKSVLYAVRTTDIANNSRTTTTFVAPVAGGAPHAFP